MFNLNGEIIKGEIEGFIENDFNLMDRLPLYYKEELTDISSIQHRLILIKNDLFTRLCDLLNLYMSQSTYGESKNETYLLDEFIEYTNLAIEKNKETVDRLLNGKDVNMYPYIPIFPIFEEDVLLKLIELAKNNDRVKIQEFLVSGNHYSNLYNNQLKKYNNFNSNFLNSVMTFAEASKVWGLGESTLRSMVNSNRLEEGKDYRKSGKVWLIKKESMIKLYGEPKTK